MRSNSFVKVVVVASSLVAVSVPLKAVDGILVVQQVVSAGGTTTVEAQIAKTKMRTEITDASGQKQIVIFDGERKVLDLINLERKTYSEMTQADVDRMGQMMQGMMAQMQAQMAAMPPAQRAQMEAMMAGRGMSAAPAKIEYRRNGTDRLGRWTCDKYDGYQNDQKVAEICTVAPTALGFGMGDFDITQQMAEFFSRMMPQMSNQMMGIGRLETQGFSGYPVKSVMTVMNRQITTQLVDARRQALSDASFVVPAGLVKQDLMSGLAGMPGMGGAAPGRGR